MPHLTSVLKDLLRNIEAFSQHASGITLRAYQLPIAQAIIQSIIKKQGLSFVVMLPRQSGKNELQAQIQTYLLTLFSQLHGEMVMISPTWKPQSLNAMRRLERTLKRNLLTRDRWKRRDGYVFSFNTANCYFLSGGPEANIVGATANILLCIDEAQDILPAKFDKDISPMGASTNVTTLFCGTAWTSSTLLAREMQAALEAQAQDGRTRVFRITADEVSAEVPDYGAYVQKQVAKLGRNHPLIKTQYYCETIDAEAGMFPYARRVLMQGDHPYRDPAIEIERPQPGMTNPVAFLIDIAGIDESRRGDVTDSPLENAAQTTVVTFPLDLPMNDGPEKGAYLESVDVYFEQLLAATTSTDALIHLVTLPADGAAIGAPESLAFSYDTGNDTAAERLDQDQHTMTLTLTTPIWIEDDQVVQVQLTIVCGGVVTLDILGARANFTLRL